MIENVKKILILVETDDGSAHQVLATAQEKQIALRFIAIDGTLKLSPELEPIDIKFKPKK